MHFTRKVVENQHDLIIDATLVNMELNNKSQTSLNAIMLRLTFGLKQLKSSVFFNLSLYLD